MQHHSFFRTLPPYLLDKCVKGWILKVTSLWKPTQVPLVCSSWCKGKIKNIDGSGKYINYFPKFKSARNTDSIIQWLMWYHLEQQCSNSTIAIEIKGSCMGNTRIKIKKKIFNTTEQLQLYCFNCFQSHHLGPSSSTTLSSVDKNKNPLME